MRKSYVYGIFMALLFSVVIGCSNDGEESATPSSEKEVEEEEFTLSTFPFTGVEMEGIVDQRAYAVMVNNHKEARPQSGLSEADIVFELLTEGDITRFLAIYQSRQPEVVGPIRSAREYYFTLADGYDAIYVYHGAADFINDMIISRGIENLPGAIHDDDGHLFVRESFRKAPHNSYFQFGAANEVAESKGYATSMEYESMQFLAEDDIVDGKEAPHVKINYLAKAPVIEYIFDHASGKYARFDDGAQTVELEDETPIQIENVMILETSHEVMDAQQRRIIDIESGGTGYLLQQGKIQDVEWENRDGRIVPVKDGEVVPLVPGQTWINFVPTIPGITEQVEIVQDEV